ncbi:hypothetical protein HYC85_017945, partial [Camellia sinensis]
SSSLSLPNPNQTHIFSPKFSLLNTSFQITFFNLSASTIFCIHIYTYIHHIEKLVSHQNSQVWEPKQATKTDSCDSHRSVSEPHRLQIHTPALSKPFHAAASSSSADLRRSTATATRSRGFITEKNSAPLMLRLALEVKRGVLAFWLALPDLWCHHYPRDH